MKKLLAIALASVLFAGCSNNESGSGTGSSGTTSTPAPAPATPATAPATPAPAPAAQPAPSAPEATPAPAATAGTLPAECEAYLKRATACFDKAAQANAASAATYRQSLDQTRAAWEQVPDKSTLASACTQMNDSFAQTAAALQCE